MNSTRAIQFKPFNGLRGYDRMITSAETPTPKRREMTEDRCAMLNEKLCHLHKNDTVVITYFTGKGYVASLCCIKEIDAIYRIIRTDQKSIPFQDLWDIESGIESSD